MTKDEIKDALTEAGIEFDPTASKSELEALLPEGAPAKGDTETIGDIEVGDPQLLRPVELPLVIKPANGGDWKNAEQAEYATYLNAYAYKNPKKWNEKRKDRTVEGKIIKGLITKLAEIGEDPSKLALYRSNDGKISFKNKNFQE